MFRTFALTGFAALIAAMTIAVAPEAQAQIGNIFSDPPLRPPGSIPRGQQQQQQAPADDDEQVPELPRGRLLPSRPAAPGQGVPPHSDITMRVAIESPVSMNAGSTPRSNSWRASEVTCSF